VGRCLKCEPQTAVIIACHCWRIKIKLRYSRNIREIATTTEVAILWGYYVRGWVNADALSTRKSHNCQRIRKLTCMVCLWTVTVTSTRSLILVTRKHSIDTFVQFKFMYVKVVWVELGLDRGVNIIINLGNYASLQVILSRDGLTCSLIRTTYLRALWRR